MAAAGIVLVPTLSTFHDLAERFEDEFAPALVDQAKRQLEEAYLTLCAAWSAGVPLAMGYDSGPPGANAGELVRMADGGIGATAALAAATAGGAKALGLDDRGVVAPGKVADLIVVDGDPVADPSILCRQPGPWLVMQGGRIVARGADEGDEPDARTATGAGAPHAARTAHATGAAHDAGTAHEAGAAGEGPTRAA
jgi:hypothetical protein